MIDENRPATRALMACLGDPSRFRLVRALIDGPRCVTDLAAGVGLSQSCTTRHLQALERRNVVRRTRDGKRVLYRIREDRAGLMPLIGWAMEARVSAAARPPEGIALRTLGPGALVGAGVRNGPRQGASQAQRPGSVRTRSLEREPRPVPTTTPPAAEPGRRAAPAPFAARPAAPGPRAEPEDEPARAQRRHGSEIEDFLL